MSDIDRRTGAVIDNYASALQAVEIIVTTRIGEQPLVREFGGGLVELLGRLMTPPIFAAFQTLLVASIDLWEPRFRVRRVVVTGSVDAIRMGSAGFAVEVDWRPRGHLGDPTIEGVRTFSIGFGRNQVQVTS